MIISKLLIRSLINHQATVYYGGTEYNLTNALLVDRKFLGYVVVQLEDGHNLEFITSHSYEEHLATKVEGIKPDLNSLKALVQCKVWTQISTLFRGYTLTVFNRDEHPKYKKHLLINLLPNLTLDFLEKVSEIEPPPVEPPEAPPCSTDQGFASKQAYGPEGRRKPFKTKLEEYEALHKHHMHEIAQLELLIKKERELKQYDIVDIVSKSNHGVVVEIDLKTESARVLWRKGAGFWSIISEFSFKELKKKPKTYAHHQNVIDFIEKKKPKTYADPENVIDFIEKKGQFSNGNC